MGNPQKINVTFYRTSDESDDVVNRFIKKDLKRMPAVSERVVHHLRLIELTEVRVLRESQKLEQVRGDIFSYRFETKSHWIRLLSALYPSDDDLVILNPVLKKTNKLANADIKLAESRFTDWKKRQN